MQKGLTLNFTMRFQGIEKNPRFEGLEETRAGGRETVWAIPRHMGKGTIRRFEIKPGFVLFLADYRVGESLMVDIDYPRPGLGFGFCLSGSLRGRAKGMKTDVRAVGGQTTVMSFRDQTGVTTDAPKSHRRQVAVLLEPEAFHSLFHGDLDGAAPFFRQTADGATPPPFVQSEALTAEMRVALDQIFNAPLRGTVRDVYLESKALELVALRMDSLSARRAGVEDRYRFSRADMDKIHDAAELLADNMLAPPTLPDLSRAVGLSHVKLNRGFRKAFDTTAFGYLRAIRLQQAKRFLETSQMNVTEASFAVGYNSLSSFSKAFYGQYGVTPHACIGKD